MSDLEQERAAFEKFWSATNNGPYFSVRHISADTLKRVAFEAWQARSPQPVAPQEPTRLPLCPSCSAADNNLYTDAYGRKMRACGRCGIQWEEFPNAMLAPQLLADRICCCDIAAPAKEGEGL